MDKYYYRGDFAGIPLVFSFRHPDTADYFNGWLRPCDPSDDAVIIPASDCERWIRDYGMDDDGNTEFGMSVFRASDALLPHARCVIHAAAMLWHKKAWLFAARGGTGKSTQLRLWKELYGEEVQIINGDKPILHFEKKGDIFVYASPWKGKEEWGDDSLSAPLGGIVLLKQGSINRIERLRTVPGNALLLGSFFSAFENADTVHQLCEFVDFFWDRIPMWELVNLGDIASAQLTREELEKELADEQIHLKK